MTEQMNRRDSIKGLIGGAAAAVGLQEGEIEAKVIEDAPLVIFLETTRNLSPGESHSLCSALQEVVEGFPGLEGIPIILLPNGISAKAIYGADRGEE